MFKTTDSKPSCFAIAALIVGLLNAVFLGVIAFQLQQFVPIIQSAEPTVRLLKEHQTDISNALDFVAHVSNATVRLLDGSFPSLLDSLLSSDITNVADLTENLAGSVHKVTCIAGGTRPKEYPNNYVYWISTYSDLVRSVAEEVRHIPANFQMDPNFHRSSFEELMTGQGGLLTETLNYATEYINSQTNIEEWSKVSCKCQSWTDLLLHYMNFKGTYGPECGYDDGGFSRKWNVVDNARDTLEDIKTTCAQLCKMEEE